MFGLIVLLMACGYLIVSVIVVVIAVKSARSNGKSAWRSGAVVTLVMSIIPFWDWIPTVLAQRYYCRVEAGFWVYKTLDQWGKENPGVFEGLVYNSESHGDYSRDHDDFRLEFKLNDRFAWIVRRQGKLFPNRWRHEQELVDISDGTVLARYVDFSTSSEAPSAGWPGWKLWLASRGCLDGEKDKGLMWEFVDQFKGRRN
ncbi:hypothetical protein ACA097_27805 [Pseudomonas sp. QL9]|uniref:hypothetical protein n=1 Tax=Pseudomonas sp. QL9 TaxID=3242725 RepID=UPI00352BA515